MATVRLTLEDGTVIGEVIDVRPDVHGITMTIQIKDHNERAPGAKHTKLCMAQKQFNPYVCICG